MKKLKIKIIKQALMERITELQMVQQLAESDDNQISVINDVLSKMHSVLVFEAFRRHDANTTAEILAFVLKSRDGVVMSNKRFIITASITDDLGILINTDFVGEPIGMDMMMNTSTPGVHMDDAIDLMDHGYTA